LPGVATAMCVKFQPLFELIEKIDLIQLFLSPWERYIFGREFSDDLVFKILPYDKTVGFNYKEDKELILGELERANKLLPKAIKKATRPILFYRRVDWGCKALIDSDYNNTLIIACGRFTFSVDDCNEEKKKT
jgi:hypothetical protein